jgi:hypothetical protein
MTHLPGEERRPQRGKEFSPRVAGWIAHPVVHERDTESPPGESGDALEPEGERASNDAYELREQKPSRGAQHRSRYGCLTSFAQ